MAALVAAVLFMGMKGPAGNTVTIQFNHVVGKNELYLDSPSYFNSNGQPFTVTKFKYYVGNIRLVRNDGREVSLPDYYLINEEEPLSKKISWNGLADGEYTAIRFIVGVDSLHNCSGAQSGALDPVNGMFWAWNTGYIFLKLEGKSPASKSPGDIFEYHIGGYKGDNNCIRSVQLDFTQPLKLAAGKPVQLNIEADAMKVLTGANTIDFEKLSSVTDFHNSTTVADNYAHMFNIIGTQP